MSKPKCLESMSPRELHRKTRKNFQSAKVAFGEAAMKISYIDELMEVGESYWDQIDDWSKIEGVSTTASAGAVLHNLYNLSNEIREQAGEVADMGGTVVVASSSYVGTTTSHWSYLFHSPEDARPDRGIRYVEICPLQEKAEQPQRHQEYARRFEAQDRELGKTYREIWEVLHKTTFPEKPASYLMRQSFDHLFRLLVTKGDLERIRNTPGRVPPDPKDPERVSRTEKLTYAADKWIENPKTRQTLKVSIGNMIDTYQEFNKILHREKPANPQVVRSTLYAMQKFLEEWADALGW